MGKHGVRWKLCETEDGPEGAQNPGVGFVESSLSPYRISFLIIKTIFLTSTRIAFKYIYIYRYIDLISGVFSYATLGADIKGPGR